MKTQISRVSHRPGRHYSGVYQQQGRMITDADWNELVDLLKERLDRTLADLVGRGVPRDGGLALQQAGSGGALSIGPGSLVAGGLHARLDAAVGFTAQPDFPGATAPPATARLYADVWELPVGALEDPALVDPGLHGADTTTRTRTLVQIKWCAPAIDPEDPAANPAHGDASFGLALPTTAGGTTPDTLAGPGNALFRLEVHRVERAGDVATLTLKWSAENGAEQQPLVLSDDGKRALSWTEQDLPAAFRSGSWLYEVFSPASERHLGQHWAEGFTPLSGVFCIGTDAAGQPSYRLEDAGVPPALADGSAPTAVRRWDGWCRLRLRRATGGVVRAELLEGWDRGQPLATVGGTSGTVSAHGDVAFAADTPSAGALQGRWHLGRLVMTLSLHGRAFLSGDHWLAVLREGADASGERDTTLIALVNDGAVAGIHHHYLGLGLLLGGQLQAETPGSAAQRRRAFPPLSDLRAEAVGYDAASTAPAWQDRRRGPPRPLRLLKALGLPGQAFVRQLAALGDGGVLLAADGAVDGGSPGDGQATLARFGSDGGRLWQRSFTGSGIPRIDTVCAAPDGGALALLSFSGTVNLAAGSGDAAQTFSTSNPRETVLLRLDAKGHLLWQLALAGAGLHQGCGLAVDSSGIVVSGLYTGKLIVGAGGVALTISATSANDGFVARLDLDGKPAWLKSLGGGLDDAATAVALDPADRSILVAGLFEGSGVVLAPGLPAISSAGEADLFLLKLAAADGTPVWVRSFGGLGADSVRGLALSPRDGAVLLTGTVRQRIAFGDAASALETGGSDTLFLASLSRDGKQLWSRLLRADRPSAGLAIAVRGDGTVALGGSFGGRLSLGGQVLLGQGVGDGFVALFGADGGLRDLQGLVGGGDSRVGAVALAGDGTVWASGGFSGTLAAGGITVTAAGTGDGFLAALGAPETGRLALPLSVQQALDRLLADLDAAHLACPVPAAVGVDDSVRRRLPSLRNLPDGADSSVLELLDALLCELDAGTLPYRRFAEPGGGGTSGSPPVSVADLMLKNTGDTVHGDLAVTGDLTVDGELAPASFRLGPATTSDKAVLSYDAGTGLAKWLETSLTAWTLQAGHLATDPGSVTAGITLGAPATRALTLTAAGRVGLGTDDPQAPWHLVKAVNPSGHSDAANYGMKWLWGQHIADGAEQMWGLTGAYGRLITWDSDGLFVGLKNEGADRKDAVIAWGDNSDDRLRFLFTAPQADGLPNLAPVQVLALSANGAAELGGDLTVGTAANTGATLAGRQGAWLGHNLAPDARGEPAALGTGPSAGIRLADGGIALHTTDWPLDDFEPTTPRVYVDPRGNVGIGTTDTTAARLVVAGDLLVTGRILEQGQPMDTVLARKDIDNGTLGRTTTGNTPERSLGGTTFHLEQPAEISFSVALFGLQTQGGNNVSLELRLRPGGGTAVAVINASNAADTNGFWGATATRSLAAGFHLLELWDTRSGTAATFSTLSLLVTRASTTVRSSVAPMLPVL